MGIRERSVLEAAAPARSVASGLQSTFAAWAVLGLVATVFSLAVFGAWVSSREAFAPVVIAPEAALPAQAVFRIRVLETVSSLIAVVAVLHFLIRPWLRSGIAPIAGLTMIGALLSYVLDTTVNYTGYFMAWNVHSINFGTWAAAFPGHTGPTRYAEALLWGPPMYLYFGVLLGCIQLQIIDRLRGALGLMLAAALSFAAAFALDIAAESFIIQSTQAYAWPNTVSSWSLWPGAQHQFPLYESLLVAMYSSGYALLLASSRRHTESFVERGVNRLPRRLRLPARFLAATGFATLLTAMYFGGFYLFSQYADSQVPLPPYLRHQG